MSELNARASADVRKSLFGKDGGLYNAQGVLLATIETFKSTVDIKNGTYRPLGTTQEREAFESYKVSLSITELVVEDETLLAELMEGLRTGNMPEWNFQGVLKGRNGDEERMVYRSCVPQGSIDLQNIAVGELIKRSWGFTVNEPPALQSLLKYVA